MVKTKKPLLYRAAEVAVSSVAAVFGCVVTLDDLLQAILTGWMPAPAITWASSSTFTVSATETNAILFRKGRFLSIDVDGAGYDGYGWRVTDYSSGTVTVDGPSLGSSEVPLVARWWLWGMIGPPCIVLESGGTVPNASTYAEGWLIEPHAADDLIRYACRDVGGTKHWIATGEPGQVVQSPFELTFSSTSTVARPTPIPDAADVYIEGVDFAGRVPPPNDANNGWDMDAQSNTTSIATYSTRTAPWSPNTWYHGGGTTDTWVPVDAVINMESDDGEIGFRFIFTKVAAPGGLVPAIILYYRRILAPTP